MKIESDLKSEQNLKTIQNLQKYSENSPKYECNLETLKYGKKEEISPASGKMD